MKSPPYPAWLPKAVLYQVFPASFCDSNGDGVGDLNGIIDKLDYISALGCNALWLCPIFDSPFRDAGYDVRDYYRVATRYGSTEDLERLILEAHARNMRILLDFVPGHTSSEHPWFLESCKHGRNAYSDRYIWTESTFFNDPEGKKSGSFINGHAERDGNYLANFFYFQPALNYGYADPDPEENWQMPTNHPSVLSLKKDMFSVMRYWLDKGIDGYRVDMAASLVKGSNPELVQQEMVEFWTEVRAWWDRDYPHALLLAEWSDPSQAIEAGFHLDFMIHFNRAGGMKPFRGENSRTILAKNDVSYFDRAGKGSLNSFFDEFSEHRRNIAGKGYLSLPSGNHDLPRYSVGRSVEDLKVIQTFVLTLPQVPTIYYGDEIGMRNLSELPSKEGAYRRTGARTPMQWDSSVRAGFSSAPVEKFYLPLDPSSDRPDAASQLEDSDSLLQHIRRLLALRKSHPALGSEGTFREVSLDTGSNYPLAYLREHDGQSVLIILNPLDQGWKLEFELEGSASAMLLGQGDFNSTTASRHRVDIGPLDSLVLEWSHAV
jgi:maltose alpha-D-glucosyltransferase/alpha-amylase